MHLIVIKPRSKKEVILIRDFFIHTKRLYIDIAMDKGWNIKIQKGHIHIFISDNGTLDIIHWLLRPSINLSFKVDTL